MAGTAHAAERIPCDRCNGHYVVDASSDGKPRVRCNTCGHLREAAEAAPVSIPGKWTVIGPDGKAMSFDTWEELTESRRPAALAASAKGMEEADKALKELSSAEKGAKKSGSQLLDVTPAPTPKLALAEMDSALDLGEPIGSRPRSRLGGSPSSPSASPKLEPLLVRSFHPQSQAPKSKVEWAPRLDSKPVMTKSDTVPRIDDNTLRVEIAPAALATPAPVTTKVIEADRPTAPNVSDGADSIDELDPDSLLEDEEEESPLSLKDMLPDEPANEANELSDADLEEDAPDPHEMLSLRDLVVASPAEAKSVSQGPPKPAVSQPPRPPPSTSQPPLPRSQVATIPPARPRLSRPDVGASKAPPVAISRRPSVAPTPEPSNSRSYILGGLALLVLGGIAWRLLGNAPEPAKPKPQPTSTVATTVPPTPVTTPAMTSSSAPPTTIASNDPLVDPLLATPAPTDTTPVAKPNTTTAPPPADTGTGTKKPVASAPGTGEKPAPTEKPTDKKPAGPVITDTAGSMSDLLDKAGAARRKGDYPTAHELYQRVLAMSPGNVEANGGMGDVSRAQGDLAGAKASYERALAASPTYSPALLGLADVEWDQGNKPSAIKRYAQIVDRLGDRAPQRAKDRAASGQ